MMKKTFKLVGAFAGLVLFAAAARAEVELPLLTKDGKTVGNAFIYNDTEYLYVALQTVDGWTVEDAHLSATFEVGDVALSSKGSPLLTKFNRKLADLLTNPEAGWVDDAINPTEVVLALAYASLDTDEPVLAIHAKLTRTVVTCRYGGTYHREEDGCYEKDGHTCGHDDDKNYTYCGYGWSPYSYSKSSWTYGSCGKWGWGGWNCSTKFKANWNRCFGYYGGCSSRKYYDCVSKYSSYSYGSKCDHRRCDAKTESVDAWVQGEKFPDGVAMYIQPVIETNER